MSEQYETSGYVTIPEGTLYYKIYGRKKEKKVPVLLLHGNRGSHKDFSSYIKALKEAGCLVIAMDSRGHGASVLWGSMLKRRITAADMAEDVVCLLDHLQLKKAVLLGFSDGANTALEFGADYPQRALKIIAVSANALPDGLIRPMYLMEEARSWLAGMLEKLYPKGKMGEWCRKQQFFCGLILHSPYLTQKRLAGIKVPVLLMAGTKDLIKESHSRWMAGCIPNSRLVLIKGGTHQGFFRRKEQYMETIIEYITKKD